jgi:outer membrane protein, heavy metal efflux system
MKTTYLLLLTLFLVSEARAESKENRRGTKIVSRPLSLNEVTTTVVANNHAIKEALAKWDAKKKRTTQEAAWDDLRVSAMSRTARFVNIPPNAFTDESVSIEQAIPLSGKNRARARIAARDAIAAYEEVRRQQLDVITKARIAYFRLANAYTQIELNDRNLASLRQIAEIGRSRYEVGTQSAADVLNAETEASKLLEARRDLENTIAANQSQLNVLMNRDAFALLAISGAPMPNHNAVRAEALRSVMLVHRPEVLGARAKVEGQQSGVDLARRAWIPDPSLTVQGQRYNGASQDVSEIDAGVSFSIPLGNYRKYSAGVGEARDNLLAAEHARERAEIEAVGLLRDAIQKADTAHHHVELFRDKLVPQGRQAFEASQFAYEAGKSGFTEWIGAQRTLRDLEAMGREHLTNYQIAMAELESVVGADLGVFGSQMKESK